MPDTLEIARGVLDLDEGGSGDGVLRQPALGLRAVADDPIVPRSLVERHALRPGWYLAGPLAVGPRPPRLIDLIEVEGRAPEHAAAIRRFEDLTAINPRERLRLETGPEPLGPRVMDLLTPIGKGQRGLIVAPPRSGKTILLAQIAAALATNHPELELTILLIDERPEEVTEARRTLRAEVLASSSDRTDAEHLRLARLAFDRARRAAEAGRHAFILLDSLTRLARVFNKQSNTGRTMSGGVDMKALEVPKRLFGAARAFEEGGSLTVLATCLIETGSRMDDLIFREFQGTGNMEVVLDRKLAERRIWPAIDLERSGSRRDDALLGPIDATRVASLRKALAGMPPERAMEALVGRLAGFRTNAEFLDRIGQATPDGAATP